MPILMAEQAKHILSVQFSTRDVIRRIEKLRPMDDILHTFDLVVADLQEQRLLTRAWSLELLSHDWADLQNGHFPLSRETALLCVVFLTAPKLVRLSFEEVVKGRRVLSVAALEVLRKDVILFWTMQT